MRVKVAIDLALDRLFTYAVPVELEKKLAVGQLLSVPFGHREARGFALAIASGVDVEPESFTVKPITAIVDEVPFFSSNLLTLVKKLAAYTGAPLEMVLRAALPAAVLKKNMHARELMFIEPALATGKVVLTKRQQWLYDQIVRLGGGWMSQLCDELKTSPATIKSLGQLGLVSVAVRAKRRDPLAGSGRLLPTKPLALNEEQAVALKMIREESRPTLLYGVTGSGKTEVYLQAIAAELESGRGAIVMVPEIALTPQTVRRFARRFGGCIAVLHSALSDGERYDEWHRIRAGEARVVVGPRSAVFAPVKNLGLIVVDEEHETSYKQDETPRYHARDAAVLRGSIEGAKVVLGSATPSLESWVNAQSGKYALATMTKRAGAGTLPTVHLVNMEEEAMSNAQQGEKAGIFSKDLMNAISLRLQRGEQTILFLNRRGYSRSVACTNCGYVVECPKCSLPYTYHRADSCLRCHICGGWVEVPKACPNCKSSALSYEGMGTQRAEAALQKCFPRAAILRMDADSTSRKHSHDDILSAFGRKEADILIGTQMIAKGLDFPNVTLVGVLSADSSLRMAGSDFRAAERTFQLLAQVSGRAGRAELPGEVFIQSYDPNMMAIRAAARGDYEGFAKWELSVRKECGFPPFCRLSMISLRSQELKLVGDWADMYAKSLKKVKGLIVSEAMPSALEKADDWYRWQIVIRSAQASTTVRAWRWITGERPPPKKLRVALDVDAVNLV